MSRAGPRSGLRALANPGEAGPVAATVAATVLWSAGNIIVRAAPFAGPQLAFFRTLLGAGVYTAVLSAKGGRLRVSTLRAAAMGGVGFALQASLFFTAVRTTTVASATVIATLQPILLLPISSRVDRVAVSRRQVVLTLVAVGGAVLVVAGSSSEGSWSPWGDLLALGSTVMGAAYFVGTKSARRTLGVIEYQAAALSVGAVAALPGALLLADGLGLPAVGDLWWPALLVAVPGTGHLLVTWAQRSLPVTFTATVTLNVLVLTVLAAAWWFAEPIDALQGLGCVVVVGALALLIQGNRTPAAGRSS